jgi:hypothetical protein
LAGELPLMAAAKKPPTIVEAIDRCLTVVNFTANGAELGSVTDRVSRALVIQLLGCRELAETLDGLLKPGDDHGR